MLTIQLQSNPAEEQAKLKDTENTKPLQRLLQLKELSLAERPVQHLFARAAGDQRAPLAL